MCLIPEKCMPENLDSTKVDTWHSVPQKEITQKIKNIEVRRISNWRILMNTLPVQLAN